MIDREWVTVIDPARRGVHYVFDVSFLLSNYTCIYGAGCKGIDTRGPDPVKGCCIHGAYLNEDDDPAELERLVREELDESTMQFHRSALRKGLFETDDEGETRTRVVEGICIFSNRAGFAAGEGCALHHLAARKGEHLMTHKPTVCWQVPIHEAVDERVGNDGKPLEVRTIGAYERGHWGEGGADFGWWCFDDETAFVGTSPLYRSMEQELRTMVGDVVFDELAAYLDARAGRSDNVRFLPIV